MRRKAKKRLMKGIPNIVNGVCFGTVDPNWNAPLHRRMGIETYVHRQAVLFDPQAQGGRGRNWANTDQHWYRYNVTLARVA